MARKFNLIYDSYKIQWEFEGQKFQRDLEGIEYADVLGEYIYIEVYKHSGVFYYYIYENNEKEICYDEANNKIIINNEFSIKFECKPYGVEVDDNTCICVLVNAYEMRLYNENGKYKSSIMSPKGYKFYRFYSVNNGIKVICQGELKNVDYFGRNDWKFRFEDNRWIMEGIAY